jgi:hypothetical protein
MLSTITRSAVAKLHIFLFKLALHEGTLIQNTLNKKRYGSLNVALLYFGYLCCCLAKLSLDQFLGQIWQPNLGELCHPTSQNRARQVWDSLGALISETDELWEMYA